MLFECIKAVATNTCPSFRSYEATGNPREVCDKPIGVAGFCISSFLKLQSGKKVMEACNEGSERKSFVKRSKNFKTELQEL